MSVKMNGKSPEQAALELSHSLSLSKATLKQINNLLIHKIPELSSTQIAALRERENVSQAVMAACLGVTPSAIQSWEQGIRSPSNSSLRLLQILDKHGLSLFVEN